MLTYMVDTHNIDLSSSEINHIDALIQGTPIGDEEKTWMFDIVSNSRNSIDVDKFDYLARDCYNLGVKSSYDFSRLLKLSRVIDSQICYHAKEVYNIYDLFHTRYNLFKKIYSHRVGNAVELMISDIMAMSDESLQISSCLNDASK